MQLTKAELESILDSTRETIQTEVSALQSIIDRYDQPGSLARDLILMDEAETLVILASARQKVNAELKYRSPGCDCETCQQASHFWYSEDEVPEDTPVIDTRYYGGPVNEPGDMPEQEPEEIITFNVYDDDYPDYDQPEEEDHGTVVLNIPPQVQTTE